MNEYFIFDDIKDSKIARAENYWYKLDLINGKILYKSKDNLKSTDLNKFASKHINSISKNNQKREIYGIPQNYYRIRKDNRDGVIDDKSNIIIDFKYSHLFDFYIAETQKLYFSAVDPKTNLHGIIDINENIIIPFMYDEIHIWNIDTINKTLIAEKDGKCGMINIHNDILIDFQYKYIYGFGVFDDNFCLAKNMNDKWGLIDKNGNPIKLDFKNVKEIN